MDHTAALTRDGGVFTFGAGMYGQLGHSSFANEMLPRKVLELMGTTVTQICCGRFEYYCNVPCFSPLNLPFPDCFRCHTLAFVPSKGRIYAFGLGGSGQLGTKSTSNVNFPQLVFSPWDTSNIPALNAPVQEKIESVGVTEAFSVIRSKRSFVRNIFCGGDQSFTLVGDFEV